MVETYHAKKRRGTAGIYGRGTRQVEPKPYWPGLEIDEQDRMKAGFSSSNVGINTNAEAAESKAKPVVKEDGQKDNDPTGEGKTMNGSASPPTKDSNDTKTKISTGDISNFRSRKRRRKLPANENDSSRNVLSQTPKNSSTIGEEQEGGSSNNAKSSIETARNGAKPMDRPPQDSIMENAVIQNTISVPTPSTKNQATAEAAAATKNNTPTPHRKMIQSTNKTDDQSSLSSSDTRPTGATPRALVKFLVQKKLPILDKVVSDIRDVLFGMVSRSPALLHKHLAEAATTSSQSSRVSIVDNGEINNICNSANSQEGINYTGTLESGRKLPPQVDSMSNFQDICKRQEKLLDRICEMELAAEKRDERSKQIQEQNQTLQQQKDQRQYQQEESSPAKPQRDYYEILEDANAGLKWKLEKANSSIETYRLELEERDKSIQGLKESKRLVQSMFQSSVNEQFRVIETHINSLNVERAENEKLRKRILLLTNESLRSAETEPNNSASSFGVETVANDAAVFSGGKAPESALTNKKNLAYSHRVRHRQKNGHQQNLLCSLQSTNSLSRSAPDRDGLKVPTPTSPAYNPRTRHVT